VKYQYHHEAERELADAADWYERQQEGLAFQFLREIEHCIDRILEEPDSHAVYEGEVRYCPVRRFPYAILYRLQRSTVQIITVMHHSRRPGYWKDRLSESDEV